MTDFPIVEIKSGSLPDSNTPCIHNDINEFHRIAITDSCPETGTQNPIDSGSNHAHHDKVVEDLLKTQTQKNHRSSSEGFAVISYHEWLKFFPYDAEVDYTKLRMTKIGRYSISRPEHADLISRHIVTFAEMLDLGHPSNISLIDATAGIGGNTLSFLKYFKYVTAIEVKKEHFDILETNLKCYKLYPRSDQLKLINRDYTMIFNTVQSDIIFFDLPWNNDEVWYSKKRDLMLYLSGIPLHTLVTNVFRYDLSRMVVCKCPFNFNFSLFIRKLGGDLIMKTVKVHSYYIILIFKNV